jgi:hypothetical protein
MSLLLPYCWRLTAFGSIRRKDICGKLIEAESFMWLWEARLRKIELNFLSCWFNFLNFVFAVGCVESTDTDPRRGRIHFVLCGAGLTANDFSMVQKWGVHQWNASYKVRTTIIICKTSKMKPWNQYSESLESEVSYLFWYSYCSSSVSSILVDSIPFFISSRVVS